MRRHLLPILVFGTFALLLVSPGLLPGHTFLPLDLFDDLGAFKVDPQARVRVSNSLLSDPMVAFLPWDLEILRLLRAGQIPFVNVFAGEGGPLWANPQTAMFSPFTWPRWLFGLDGWVFTAFLKLLAAGLGMFWLARELSIPRRPALLSGLVYAGGAFSVVWLLFPIGNVAACLPALAAAALRQMRCPSRRSALGLLLLAFLATAGGHPETLFVGVCGIAAFLVLEARALAATGQAGASLMALLGRPALWSLLGFGLLAFQLLPFFLVLRDSAALVERSGHDPSFRPWSLVAQVLPGALGSPLAGELDLSALALAENFNSRSGAFIGALALLAVLVAWPALSPALRRGLGLGLVALALSWNLPGLSELFRRIPLVGTVAAEYLVVVWVLFGSLAAGPALVFWASRRRPRLAGVLALLGASAVLAGSLPSWPAARPGLENVARQGIEILRSRGHLQRPAAVYEERLVFYLEAAGSTTWRRLALPGFCFVLAGLALGLTRLPPNWRENALAAAALGELFVFGFGYNPAPARTNLPPAPPALAELQRLDPEGHYLMAAHHSIFPANLATLYGRRDVFSYDVLIDHKRGAALEKAGYDRATRSLRPRLEAEEVAALGRLGVRYVLSEHDVPGARRREYPPLPQVGIYEIELAEPQPWPGNEPPKGAAAGAALTLLVFLGSTLLLVRQERGGS